MKFESDRSNPLEVIISQTQEFGKAIRPFLQIKSHICQNTHILTDSHQQNVLLSRAAASDVPHKMLSFFYKEYNIEHIIIIIVLVPQYR